MICYHITLILVNFTLFYAKRTSCGIILCIGIDMLEWYEILIIVIGTLVFVYVLGFMANLGFVVVFRRKINEHKKAIIIVLTQKREALLSLIEIMEKNELPIDPKYYSLLKDIDIRIFEEFYSQEAKKSRETLSYARQELIGFANKNASFQKNGEFKLSAALINSLDEQFRYLAATYNADVIGYNYWIKFKPYAYIFLLNKNEKKDLIS